jgi:murein DD-endopeptidase MepM/ murein hydrolase activator NlpD
MLEVGTVRVPLARRLRRITAPAVGVALIVGCTSRGDAPPAGDSSASMAGASHVNGAALDTPPPAPRVALAARALERPSRNGAAEAPPDTSNTLDDDSPPVRSPAVASTPDELSALAASLVVPVAGVTPAELRSSFDDARGGGTRRHNALDIPAPRGTPVISATPGRVLRLYNSKAGGIMIYAADATERFILMYGHLDRYADGLKEGMRLARGQTIGYVGTTGNAPANVPHLHFAIARTSNVERWWTGTPVDPAPLLKR